MGRWVAVEASSGSHSHHRLQPSLTPPPPHPQDLKLHQADPTHPLPPLPKDHHEHPGGPLRLRGANEDSLRIARMIDEQAEFIDDIYVTLDTHHKLHIAHAASWRRGPYPAKGGGTQGTQDNVGKSRTDSRLAKDGNGSEGGHEKGVKVSSERHEKCGSRMVFQAERDLDLVGRVKGYKPRTREYYNEGDKPDDSQVGGDDSRSPCLLPTHIHPLTPPPSPSHPLPRIPPPSPHHPHPLSPSHHTPQVMELPVGIDPYTDQVLYRTELFCEEITHDDILNKVRHSRL